MKGLFFATLPKSGTSFTHSTIAEITPLEIPAWMRDSGKMAEWQTGVNESRRWYWASGEFMSCRLEKDGLRRTLAKPHVITSHLPASHHNLHTLVASGVESISILLRDPRDATVSWVHHLRKYGPGTARHTSHFQYLPPQYFDWDLEAQMEFNIATFLPQAVEWIESWLFALTKNEFPGLKINLFYYDELRSRPRQYFKRLLLAHGITSYDETRIAPPKPGEKHFRKGEHESWRGEFPKAWHPWIDRLMTRRLERAFADAALACPHLRASREAGDSPAGRITLERHLYQFPSSQEGWRLASGWTGVEATHLLESEDNFDRAGSQFVLPMQAIDALSNAIVLS